MIAETLGEENVSPTEYIIMTQERLALRAFDPTTPSKMMEFKLLDTKEMICMMLLQGRVVF